MKKYINYLVVLVLTLVFVLQSTSATLAQDSTELMNAKIKNVIQDYFVTELEAIKHNKYDKNVISDLKVKEYQTTYVDFLDQWYSKAKLNLTDYTLYVDIDSTEYKDNTCTVFVTQGVDMIFDIAPVVQKARDEKYKFVLAKKDDLWKITDVIKPNDEEFNLDKKIVEIKENIKKIDTLIANLSPKKSDKKTNIQSPLKLSTNTATSLTATSLSSPSFNRTAAKWYAQTYWQNHNPNYPYWTDNDCTNFVSQCWKEAGVTVTPYWYCNSAFDYTASWTVVNNFKDYMYNNGWCYISSSQYDSQIGDVIQLYNSSKGTWSHSVIITFFDIYHNPYYCAHSVSRYDYALSNVYPSSTYTDARYLCVYNF